MILLNTAKKSFLMAVLLGVAFSLFSCGDDLKNTKYTPDNNNVSFPAATASYALIMDESEFYVDLNRGIANNTITVDVKMEDPSGLFTLATPSVTFQAGEFVGKIGIKYTSGNLAAGTSYPIKLTFNESDMSIAGINAMTANAMLKLEYVEYGSISCAKGNFFGLLTAEQRTFKLYLAQGTTNYYKIENLYGGGQDVEFGIKNGGVTFFNPVYAYYNAEDVAGYPLHKIPTAMNHPSYGLMTAWLDSDPANVTCKGLGAGDKLILGSTMDIKTWYTVSAGYFGWYGDMLQVTAVK